MSTVDNAGSQRRATDPLVLDFDDNRLLTALFGEYDRNLSRIEQKLGVSLTSRGNRVAISGSQGSRDTAGQVLNELYARLQKGLEVTDGEIDGAIRMAEAIVGGEMPASSGSADHNAIKTGKGKRRILPRSPNQARYIQALNESELVFGLGPAGTGKTYLAVALAVSHLLTHQVDRIILSRPAVEAGERLGFLPGDMKEKVDPYLRPLYDALYDMLPAAQVVKRIEAGEIEIAPLAFMRGRTLANSFVILDEAQNTTPVQMKMLLTRLGENSRMAVTGDPSQIDLPPGARSGLHDAVTVLQGVEGVSFVHFEHVDVVRHPMVTRVLKAYAAKEPELFDLGNGNGR
ncbi:MAG: PhoH family protein [Minwuiales bacterium]|nr:PhoH family protein [Minwuiales bacterium]